jgi:hypothetical protein
MLIAGSKSVDIDPINNEAFKEYNGNALDSCPCCARVLLPDRIIAHMKFCRRPFSNYDGKIRSKSSQLNGKVPKKLGKHTQKKTQNHSQGRGAISSKPLPQNLSLPASLACYI